MPHPWRHIVLTGASSGIGAALARALAAPGVTLLLTGRDPARLEAVAAQARAAGATVQTAATDVRDPGMATLLTDFDTAHPVDLVIANAGVSAGLGPDRGPEAPGTARRLVEVNLLGPIQTVEPLFPGLIARGRGQIALVASAAALRPIADMPSYSATKAGLRGYGIALRGWLRPHGVAVSVVCPGFVTSAMTARHHGPKPFEIPADRAARAILAGLRRRQATITFPWQLRLMIGLGGLLPAALSDRFAALFAARIEPDGRD